MSPIVLSPIFPSFFKKTCLCLCAVLCFGIGYGQAAGKVLEQQVIHSGILKKDVHYTMYLPPDYSSSDRTYPVVYLLHGYSDDNTGWLQFGEINRYADKAIDEGIIPPMIIVMPNGDSSWFVNSYDGKERYEDFFFSEFMPVVEKTYRIKAEKRYRGIAGLSMGGYGSFLYAFKHPELFAAAAPLSAAINSDTMMVSASEENWKNTFGQLYGRGLKGRDRLTQSWNDNSILGLAERKSAEELKQVRYWIDVGDKDHLSEGNCLLHILLMEKKVPHEFRIRDGAHNWTYWRTGITDALQFIGQSFHQQ